MRQLNIAATIQAVVHQAAPSGPARSPTAGGFRHPTFQPQRSGAVRLAPILDQQGEALGPQIGLELLGRQRLGVEEVLRLLASLPSTPRSDVGRHPDRHHPQDPAGQRKAVHPLHIVPAAPARYVAASLAAIRAGSCFRSPLPPIQSQPSAAMTTPPGLMMLMAVFGGRSCSRSVS
jgi:hypothetical protein